MVESLVTWMRRRRAHRRRFNPYVAGSPVFDRQLYVGREEVEKRALDLLGWSSVRITGQHRIGKTSFLYHLRRALASDADQERHSYPVFVDLEALHGTGLFGTLMQETVEAVFPAAGPSTALHAGLLGDGYDDDAFHRDLGRLLEGLRARAPRPVRLVLLVDEVDALRRHSNAIGDDWVARLLAAFPHELRLVLAGVQPHPKGRAGVASAFVDLELEPLTRKAARELVERPVSGVYRYETLAVEKILDLSGRRPYTIQRLCLQAVNRMLDDGRRRIRAADVAPTPDCGRQGAAAPAAALHRDEQPAS